MTTRVNDEKVRSKAAARETAPSRRAKGHNGGRAPAGLFSWYTAQPAQPGATYALTANGYVILTHRN